MIISYQTNTHISHFIPQNHFRWNFSKRTAGESTGKVGTEQINSNEHYRQKVIKSISTSKQPQSFQKYSSKIRKSVPFNSVHQCTNQIVIQPYHPPPWRAHLGRANAPAEAPGPGRSEEWARYHMKIHTHKSAEMQKHPQNTKLRKNLKITMKRVIILVRTSRFWYDNGMLWYCNCCFEIMNDHKKIVKI